MPGDAMAVIQQGSNEAPASALTGQRRDADEHQQRGRRVRNSILRTIAQTRHHICFTTRRADCVEAPARGLFRGAPGCFHGERARLAAGVEVTSWSAD
jgi:hypothetical protein